MTHLFTIPTLDGGEFWEDRSLQVQFDRMTELREGERDDT